MLAQITVSHHYLHLCRESYAWRYSTQQTHLLPLAHQHTHAASGPSPSLSPFRINGLLEFLVNFLKPLKEALEGEDTKSWVLATSCCPDRMHTELWNTTVDGSDTCCSTQHWADRSSTAAVVANLEDLQLRVLLACTNVGVNTTLEDGGADGISRHVCVGVGRNGRSNVQPWGVVLKVGVQKVGVDGVNDVARDQEGVCVGARKRVLDLGFGELLHDTLKDNRQEIATGALTQ